VAVADTVVVTVEAGRVVVEAGRVMSDVTVDAGSVMSSVMVDAAGVSVIVDVKVTSGNVEVTVAVIVDNEVIVSGTWQDDVGEDVEEAEVADVVLDVTEDNVYVKQ